MNKLVKDALILTLITLIAGVALGAVYEITKAPIAAAQEAATQAAYREVFADADSFVVFDSLDRDAAAAAIADLNTKNGTSNEIESVVMAMDSTGNQLGYVITMVSHSGYGGDITLSMGVAMDGTLNGYSITDISETAGLGMKSTEEAFMSQFRGIPAATTNTLEVTKTGATSEYEIDAISGATITSNAVTYAVDAGLLYASVLIGGAQ